MLKFSKVIERRKESGIILTISEVSGHAESEVEEKPSEQPKTTDKVVDSAKSEKEGENEHAAGDAQASGGGVSWILV